MISLPLIAALALASAPKVGDAAPDFTATDTDGKAVTLSTLLKDGPVILAFFPKAFTPG
jgi:peroxiredoxin Q/BCP